MRWMGLGLAFIGASAMAQQNLTGHWIGTFHPDRAVLFSNLKNDRHKRLLEYALGRLSRSRYVLDLSPNGRFRYFFDDGAAFDRQQYAGRWVATSDTLTLQADGSRHASRLGLSHGHIMDLYNDVPGAVVVFDR